MIIDSTPINFEACLINKDQREKYKMKTLTRIAENGNWSFNSEKFELIVRPYINTLTIVKDKNHYIGYMELKDGRVFYIDSNDIRFYMTHSIRFTLNKRFDRAYNPDGSTNHKVRFINFDKDFERNFVELIVKGIDLRI